MLTYFNKPSLIKANEKKFEDAQPKAQVKNRALPFILIVLSVKISYFFDREKSLNFTEDPVFTKLKAFVQNDLKEILGLLGIIGLIAIENFYINKKYHLSENLISRYLSNLISMGLLANHYLSTVDGPIREFSLE